MSTVTPRVPVGGFDPNRRRSMYDEKRGDLTVKVTGLKNFKTPSGCTLSDIHCVFKLSCQDVESGPQQTSYKETIPSVFNETFKFPVSHVENVNLMVTVFGTLAKSNGESTKYNMGSCVYPLKVLELDFRPIWIYCHQLPPGSDTKLDRRRSKIVTGEVQIASSFEYLLKSGKDIDRATLKEDGAAVNDAVASKIKIIKKRIWDRKVELRALEKKCEGLTPSQAREQSTKIAALKKEIEYLEGNLGQKVFEDPAKADLQKQNNGPALEVVPRTGRTRVQSMRNRTSTYRESMREGTNLGGEISPFVSTLTEAKNRRSMHAPPSKVPMGAPSPRVPVGAALPDIKDTVARAIKEALIPLEARVQSLSQQLTKINLNGGAGASPGSVSTGSQDADARIAKLEAELEKRDAIILKKDLLLKKTLLSYGESAPSSVMQELSNHDVNSGTENFDDTEEIELRETKKKLLAILSETNQRVATQRKTNLKNEIGQIQGHQQMLMAQGKQGPQMIPPPPGPPGGPPGPPPPPPPPGAPGAPGAGGGGFGLDSLLSFPKGGSNNKRANDLDLDSVMNKLEKLDKLDSILSKLNDLNVSGGGPAAPSRSLEVIQKEMSEQLEIILDDAAPEKAKEVANIKYEQLISEMEKSPEFVEQQKKIRKEKEEKERPINQAAYDKYKKSFTSEKLANPDTRKKVRRNPELILISMDSQQILLRHANDFRSFVLTGLSSDELRALYFNLPNFKKDQQFQADFKERVFNKIDEQMLKEEELRKNPPKKKTAKKLVFKKVEGDMMDELKKFQGQKS